MRVQSTVRKKMATIHLPIVSLRTETLKERIKAERKIANHSNSTTTCLLNQIVSYAQWA